jgi:hypothetical protein
MSASTKELIQDTFLIVNKYLQKITKVKITLAFINEIISI